MVTALVVQEAASASAGAFGGPAALARAAAPGSAAARVAGPVRSAAASAGSTAFTCRIPTA
jgi:hypothetical protein